MPQAACNREGVEHSAAAPVTICHLCSRKGSRLRLARFACVSAIWRGHTAGTLFEQAAVEKSHEAQRRCWLGIALERFEWPLVCIFNGRSAGHKPTARARAQSLRPRCASVISTWASKSSRLGTGFLAFVSSVWAAHCTGAGNLSQAHPASWRRWAADRACLALCFK